MFFVEIFLFFNGLSGKRYITIHILRRKKHIRAVAYSENVLYFYRSIPHKGLLIYDCFYGILTQIENIRLIPGPNLKIRTNEKAMPDLRGTIS